LILKIGAIYSFNEHSRIGINVTTHSINIYGRGSNKKSISQTNVGNLILDTTGVLIDDILISSYADGLKANFKSPLSIAIGYNVEFKKHSFGFAVEYFNEVKPYKVISGEETNEFINTSNTDISETNFLNLAYGQRSIINFAVSYERKLSEVVTILTGLRTNFTTSIGVDYQEEYKFNHIEDIDVNYYHFTGGSTFSFLNNSFIFGIDFALSHSNNVPYLVNFSEPLITNNESIPLRGNIENKAKINNYMLGFVIGYSLEF
jgi:hypothetical protein